MKFGAEEYTVEIDNIQQEEWERQLEQFNDSTIYQTWSYGKHQYGGVNLTHVVAKIGNDIVSMAQGKIAKVPFLKIGIAQFSWAPIWIKKNMDIDYNIFKIMIQAIYNEYAIKRGLLVRVKSNIYSEDKDKKEKIDNILNSVGFKCQIKPHYRTVIVDLTPPLQKLRMNLKGSWRRHLNYAEKQEYSVNISSNCDDFRKYIALHKEMFSRKKIVAFNPNMKKYLAIQNDLPDEIKMVNIICEYQKKVISAIILAVVGESGMYFLGASSNQAIKNNLRGSYLLHCHAIKWLKENGYKSYDLRGYNPELYPGVSRFKEGFNGIIVEYPEYIAFKNWFSFIIVKFTESLLLKAKKIVNRGSPVNFMRF